MGSISSTMVMLVHSETTIGGTAAGMLMSAAGAAVTPGSGSGTVVGDWAGIDPLSIAGVAVAGGVLLLVGGRLLKPALVLAVAMVGAILGLQLAGAARDGSLPAIVAAVGIPPLAWVVSLPLLFGLAAACLARFAMAVLLGGAVGSAVLLIGLAVATGGSAIDPLVDPAVPSDPEAASRIDTDAEAGSEAPTDLEEWSEEFGERIRDAVIDDAMEEFVGEDAAADLDRLGDVVPSGLGAWWRETTAGVPSGTLDLIVALATVVALCTAMLAILLPERSAVLVTSVCGGWLVSGAAMAAWVRWIPDASPPTPFMTLLAWGVLAALGVLQQGRQGRRAKKPPRTRE